MKYAIIYSSATGNTKFLAESLNIQMKGTDCVLCEIRQADNIEADFYFVGFWTCSGLLQVLGIAIFAFDLVYIYLLWSVSSLDNDKYNKLGM